MLKNTLKLLVVFALTIMFAGITYSQTSQEWQTMFARANQTAVFENGKIRSVKVPIPNESEKTFYFEHSQNGNSVTITDDQNETFQIFLTRREEYREYCFPKAEKQCLYGQKTQVVDLLFKI